MNTVLDGVRMIVYPAEDLATGIATWTELLGAPPAYGNADFCVFDLGVLQIGLNRMPWVPHPLVFWKVASVEEAHKDLVAGGAVPMTEIGDGDPETGIVHLPTVTLAILRAPDGSLVGIRQDLPWS